MIKVTIDQPLKAILPKFTVGVLEFVAEVNSSHQLDELINQVEQDIKTQYALSDVLQIDEILASRNGYKALGKDPSRYRLAVESLYRRIVKGNPLYRINNLVDIGNLLSLQTKRSIAVLDANQIQGDVLIRIGQDEPYVGIGRGDLNISNIPVYCDDLGPFGSPTSDTQRTMITDQTKQVLVFIISFNGNTNLIEDLEHAKNLFSQYASGKTFYQDIVY